MIQRINSKSRTRYWIEINDKLWGKYDNSDIRFKTSVVSSNFYGYSDAGILAKGTITVPNMGCRWGRK